MFQMMNEARLGVGMGGPDIASAAYHFSKQYANERSQGRLLTNKDRQAPTLIKITEMFSACCISKKPLWKVRWVYYSNVFIGMISPKQRMGKKKRRPELLLDFMTPVAENSSGGNGILAVNQGLQVLGGYGYTEDFPLEQWTLMSGLCRFTREPRDSWLDVIGKKHPLDNGQAL
jgi:butyryl-CoA dehydrogenase